MGVAGLLLLIAKFLFDVAIGALFANKLQRSSKSHDEVPRQDPVIELGVDASCPLHNLLHRHAKDIILRSSWLSFRSSVRQLLAHYISWAATKNNPAANAGIYTAVNPCPFLLMVFDGARLSSKQVNQRRSKDRSAAQETLLQHFTENEDDHYTVDEKLLGQAIGGYNIEAMGQFIEVCDELGVRWEIAPCEAEHQLCYYQKVGYQVQYILTYDSDVIATGGSNVFLDAKHHMHQGMVKYYPRPEKLMDGEALRKLQLPYTIELKKQKLAQLSGQKEKKITAAARQEFLLAEILQRDGFRFIQIARCILRSDYNFFPSVGVATVIRLYMVMLQTREACTPLAEDMTHDERVKATFEYIKSMTVREIFSTMANLLYHDRLVIKNKTAPADEILPHGVSRVQEVVVTLIETAIQDDAVPMVLGAAEPAQDSAGPVQGAPEPGAPKHGAAEPATPKLVNIQNCACPCCSASFLPGRQLNERDIIVRLEAAWIMFQYSLVRSIKNELITLNPLTEQSLLDELQFHSLDELNIHIGLDHFNGIDLELFAKGGYDVRDFSLKHPIVPAASDPDLVVLNPKGEPDSDHVVLNPEGPVLLLLSDLPSESEINAMSVANLEKWLKHLKKPHSMGVKDEKRERLLSAIRMCRAIGRLPEDTAPTEDEYRVVGKSVTEVYEFIDKHRTEWKSAFDMKDDNLVSTF